MVIKDLFSKRNRTIEPAPLVRDVLPSEFRAQVTHIWKRALGYVDLRHERERDPWQWIHDTIAEEHGLFGLGRTGEPPLLACHRYFYEHKDVDKALDVLELSFRVIERVIPKLPSPSAALLEIKQSAPDAIADLNTRFDEHNLGYQYNAGQIIRRDSEYLHAEVAEPTLRLLHAEGFVGAEEEFRSAHAHFRHGRMKEATVDALKAFESTIKTICALRMWTYKSTATAKDLIQVVLENGLIPGYLESELGALRSMLESAVPTLRNKSSGHGQGALPVPVPSHLAAFALHTAAANIVLLMQAHNALK